jgi:hypothetical protein
MGDERYPTPRLLSVITIIQHRKCYSASDAGCAFEGQIFVIGVLRAYNAHSVYCELRTSRNNYYI